VVGGGDCTGGCIVMMTTGITVAEFPWSRFRKPPPHIQPMSAKASQTNTR
jgi:hypothetical protein